MSTSNASPVGLRRSVPTSRDGNFACLMKTPTGHWYWRYPDYQGLFPYGATGPFDEAFLKDALSRRVLEPVAWTSDLPQNWA